MVFAFFLRETPCTPWLYFFLVFFLLPGSFLQAQNSGYFLDSSSGEIRYIQRLIWTGDEYAQRYEVVIEREREGAYQEMLRESTTALYIQISLLPGKYRCRVITYDFLNQAGGVSEWVYIEVLAVLYPEQVYKTDDIELVRTADDSGSVQPAGYQRRPDLFLGAGWLPLFAIYDEKNRLLGRNHSFAGGAVRFGAVWGAGNFNPGLELAIPYNFVDTDTGDLHLWGIGLNLLARKRLPDDRMALTFRLGAGYGDLFYANIGVSFLFFARDNLYLETGLDYAHWFTDPPSGGLRPWLGAGWRF
jgi:hypothetical protein